MKANNENKLDRYLKSGLSGAEDHISFRDEDWAAMEKLLDGKKKRPAIIWLYRAAVGIAALLFMFFGWQFLRATKAVRPSNHLVVKTPGGSAAHQFQDTTTLNTSRKDQGAGASANRLASAGKKEAARPAQQARHISVTPILPRQNNFVSTGGHQKQFRVTAGADTGISKERSKPDNVFVKTGVEELLAQNGAGLTADPLKLPLIAFNHTDTIPYQKPGQKKPRKPAAERLETPRFSFAILTASDVNGVGSVSNGKLGSNTGLTVFFHLSNRWSISTGAGYAAKPYGYDQSQQSLRYYPELAGTTTSIYANCKVLDIPLNVNYLFYNKGRNAFSLGTGLSSYFMLHEHYQLNYADNATYNINIANQNQHIFGVVNINAGYQRQLTPTFNLLVQPYYKLPITNIGYEKVSLQSAGVAVGMGWSFGR